MKLIRRRMIKKASVLLVAWVCGVSVQGASWVDYSNPTCQMLDNPLDPLYTVDIGFIPESRLVGYGETGMLEIDGQWNDLAYFRDVLSGDMDLDFNINAKLFLDSAEIELPDQVARIAFDSGWTWRYADGGAFQFRVKPGMYSDMEEISSEVWYVPVSVAFIRSFHPDISGLLGVEGRPGFDRVFMPLVGIDWLVHEKVRLSARLPESRMVIHFTKYWNAFLGFEWNNISYALREKSSYRRDMMTYEDFRYTGGVTYKMSDDLQLTVAVGSAFERSIEFEKPAEDQARKIDMEREAFVRFGIGGPF